MDTREEINFFGVRNWTGRVKLRENPSDADGPYFVRSFARRPEYIGKLSIKICKGGIFDSHMFSLGPSHTAERATYVLWCGRN